MMPLVYLMTMPSYSPIKKEYIKSKIQGPSCRFHLQKFLDVFLHMVCSATESEFPKKLKEPSARIYIPSFRKTSQKRSFSIIETSVLGLFWRKHGLYIRALELIPGLLKHYKFRLRQVWIVNSYRNRLTHERIYDVGTWNCLYMLYSLSRRGNYDFF